MNLRSRRIRRIPAIALLPLSVACAGEDALSPDGVTDRGPDAAFAVVTRTNNEIYGTFYNSCTDEVMEFHGTMHVLITLTTDAAGGEHYHLRYTFGPAFNTGTETGTVYQAQSNFSYMESTLPSGVYETTVIRNRPFSGQGTAPNWDLHYRLHITVTADGVTVSDPEDLSVTCK